MINLSLFTCRYWMGVSWQHTHTSLLFKEKMNAIYHKFNHCKCKVNAIACWEIIFWLILWWTRVKLKMPMLNEGLRQTFKRLFIFCLFIYLFSKRVNHLFFKCTIVYYLCLAGDRWNSVVTLQVCLEKCIVEPFWVCCCILVGPK